MLVAVVGTLNPTGGDVSVFLPIEQSVLSDSVGASDRTLMFGIYNVLASLAGALGALAAGFPAPLTKAYGLTMVQAERVSFVAYAVVAAVAFLGYLFLAPAPAHEKAPRAPLQKSRRIVFQLSALFSLDSLGGGFVVQALLVHWLFLRFGLDVETTAAIFFGNNILTALSQLASPRLAARIGLIRTMVFTHLPANIFLILAGVVPSAGLAVLFLLLRSSLSSMDVPARQSYVMAVVPPEERAAAASVTNVPRSLASALPPLLVGWMLAHSVKVGWPLILGGALKAIYDVLLFFRFRGVKEGG
jgi:MFS family permease